jgi:hypothetical protein
MGIYTLRIAALRIPLPHLAGEGGPLDWQEIDAERMPLPRLAGEGGPQGRERASFPPARERRRSKGEE